MKIIKGCKGKGKGCVLIDIDTPDIIRPIKSAA